MHLTPLSVRRRRVLPFSLLVLLLPLGAAAQRGSPERDAFRLVAQAFNAKRDQHFLARQEIVLYQAAPNGAIQAKTQIVADIAQDGGRVRRTFHLPADAADRVEVDDGRVFQQWEPSQHLVFLKQSHEAAPQEKRRMLGLLHSNYRCLPQYEQEVNGFPCDVILIRPLRVRGGGKRVWVDRAHHAILRTEEYDTSGRLCYLSFYRALRFVQNIPMDQFRLDGMGQVRRMPRLMRDVPDAATAFAAAGVPGRLPAWLPPGYARLGCARGGHAAILRYGDGLQTFIVIEEKGDRPGGPRGDTASTRPARHGQVGHYGQQLWETTDCGLHVTVVGNAMLPDSLGRDVLWSFMPEAEDRLRSSLARDFGPRAVREAAPLRGRGWSYDQIVSLALYLHKHPGRARAAAVRMAGGQDWAQVMAGLHADADPWEQQARSWMASALREPLKTEGR